MNIAMLLEMAADAFPGRIAMSCGGADVSFAELQVAARGAASLILGAKVGHVVYLDVSGLSAPVALFGAALAGVPYVPLNYRLTKLELDELLARVSPALLIGGASFVEGLTIPAGVSVVETAAFMRKAHKAIIEPANLEIEASAVAVQLFTSGTTGRPKAALLRHEHFSAYILSTVEFGSAEEGDSSILTVPPYHIAGIVALLSTAYAGRRTIQLPNFDAAEWLRLVRAHNVTNAFLVPTMLGRILSHLESAGAGADIPSLRAIAYGGGKMPVSTIVRAMAMFPDVAFVNAYGLTETSSTICLLSAEDHRLAASSSEPGVRARLSSVGRPLPSVELEIRDETGALCSAGEAGAVYVRGAQVSGEYVGVGSLLDAKGWFPTRDRGWLDAEGYLFLDGRADDVIVRGGENISPGEIEDVLLEHPAVADAAIVSTPDEQWGEAIAAAIVLHNGALASVEELQVWVRARLRSSRVPQIVEFWPELPYNETGKVLRRAIRQHFTERHGPGQ